MPDARHDADASLTRRDLELLCRVKLTSGRGRSPGGTFGNIIELGSRSLLLEASGELQPGDKIVVEVVFPGQGQDGDPVSRLQCVVRKSFEEPALHYSVDIEGLDDRAYRRLIEYLRRSTKSISASEGRA